MNAGTLTIIFVGLISHVMQGNSVRATLFASQTFPHDAVLLLDKDDLQNSPTFAIFCGALGSQYPDCGDVFGPKGSGERIIGVPKCIISDACSNLIGYQIDSWLQVQGLEAWVTKDPAFDDHVPPLQSTSDCQVVVSSVLAAKPGDAFAGFLDYSGYLYIETLFCDTSQFVPTYRWPHVRQIASSVGVEANLLAGAKKITILDVQNASRFIELDPYAVIGVFNIPAKSAHSTTEHHFPIHYSAFADCSHTVKAIPVKTAHGISECKVHPLFGTNVECSNSQLP